MNIGIAGLGLIGGSFAKTVKKNTADLVFGYDLNAETLEKAILTGAIDKVLSAENAGSVDLLVAAVNPSDFLPAVSRYFPLLKSGATVMDFCGVKRGVTAEMRALSEKYPELNFIGGHPMAGREFSGFDKSLSTLFNKASMIFVPVKTDIFVLDEFKKYFLSLGFSKVVITTSENHDKMIAYTSQLCHIVSNAFIKSDAAREHSGYSAGSYKDLTRVARLDPVMWSKLMSENVDFLENELETLIVNLNKYLCALKSRDENELRRLLEEGNAAKTDID